MLSLFDYNVLDRSCFITNILHTSDLSEIELILEQVFKRFVTQKTKKNIDSLINLLPDLGTSQVVNTQ